MLAGSRPKNLGVRAGNFNPCPNKPNCVSSQAVHSDSHFIAPIAFNGSAAEAIARIKRIVIVMPRTKIIDDTPDYLYAEFKSRLLGFIDDVEFYADPNTRLIHVRSASRLGYRDLNVNRERVEALRLQFNAR